MKNKFMIGTVLTSMLLMTTPVEAMGNATVQFTSNDSIQVGDTFTVSMSVKDINDTYDGIVSMGGNLSFDSNMIEYVSSKGIETPYLFQINEDYNYKIAGLDFTLDNGIRDTLTVYEFTFKALKEGNTTITLENAKLTDSQSYIDTIVLEKEISINEKEELPVIEIKPEIITNKEVTTNNKEETVVRETVKEEKPEMKEENNSSNEVVIEVKEESNPSNEVVIETKEESSIEKETLIQKIQKVFDDLLSKFRSLFK